MSLVDNILAGQKQEEPEDSQFVFDTPHHQASSPQSESQGILDRALVLNEDTGYIATDNDRTSFRSNFDDEMKKQIREAIEEDVE